MNAVFTFLHSQISKRQWGRNSRRRRRQQSDTDNDFLEPSVTITQRNYNYNNNNNDNNNNNNINDSNPLDTSEQPNEEVSFLYQLCKRWAWPAVIFRAQQYPDEANAAIDSNGDTVLHWTCFGSPPYEAIEALLNANPNLAQIPNYHGNLPLHVACSYRASSDIIQLLVQTYPESVDIPNLQGSYPLHILCDYGCSMESIHAILQQSVSSVTQRDQLYCRTPLLILNERKNMHEFHDSLHTLRLANALGDGYRSSLPGLTRNTLLSRCREMAFWKKACLLILAEYTNAPLASLPLLSSSSSQSNNNDDATTANDNHNHNHANDNHNTNAESTIIIINNNTKQRQTTKSTGIVHACLRIQHCPPALLEFAVLVHADELLLSDSNIASGQLPLHVAVQRCNLTTILDLLQAQPKAARIPNKNGKFPLQVVLERFSKDSSSSTTTTSSSSSSSILSWNSIVKPFVLANPLALESLYLDKRLYPLIWAKLIATKEFDTIYESFCGNPIMFATHNQ